MTGFAQLAALREPAAVGGWLGQIAISLVRRRIRRARLLRRLGLDRGADDATLESLGDPGLSPEERTDLALVDRALQAVSAACRIAWMLRRVEGSAAGRGRRAVRLLAGDGQTPHHRR